MEDKKFKITKQVQMFTHINRFDWLNLKAITFLNNKKI